MSGRIFGAASGSAPGVKICGVTSGEQAARIAALGADAIGVNLWPRSKRHCSLESAVPWLVELSGTLVRVAVFVNPAEDDLQTAHASGAFDFLQLHGDESPEQVSAWLGEGYPVFKALGVQDRASLDRADAYAGDILLLDAYAPLDYGGTGETMDWRLGAEAVGRWPGRGIVLAGGLTPENVGGAVRQVRPSGVDVASGVESAPGVKDLGRVRDFIAEVRAAAGRET